MVVSLTDRSASSDGDVVESTVGDAPEVQAETMRCPTVRRLVLVPQVGDSTPHSIQDEEVLEEAPDPHAVPFVEAPSDAEGAPLSSVSDTESLGDGQSDFVGEEEFIAPEPEPIREADHARVTPAIREGLRSLDHVDLVHLFSIRAVVMKSPPKFVRGAYRAAMRIALEEIVQGHQAQNEDRQSRGWKVFVLLPRMLLFRPPRGGLIPKQRVLDRFAEFARGSWTELLISSRECSEAARKGSIRRRRTQTDSLEKRAERAQMLILMGEVSAGRHALDGAAVAPGTQDTLNQLRRRPQSAEGARATRVDAF